MLEQIVLYDELVVSRVPDIDESASLETGRFETDESMLLQRRVDENPILTRLIAANAIRFVQANAEKTFEETSDILAEMSNSDGPISSYVSFFVWEMRWAFRHNLPYVPSNHDVSRAALSFCKKEELHQLSMLSKTYSDISRDFQSQIQRLAQAGASKRLVVPPIAAIILDRAQGQQERIAEVALELREEFGNLRRSFVTYQKKIRDDSLPIGDSLNELERAVQANCPDPEATFAKTVTEWRDLASLNNWLDGVSTGDVSSGVRADKAGSGVTTPPRSPRRRSPGTAGP